LKTSDFDYLLPEERIAQRPIEPRDAARLMILNRTTGEREHHHFHEIENYLRAGDVLVVNRSRVMPARLAVRKIPGGGKAELLLLEQISSRNWKVIVGGKGLRMGKKVEIRNGISAEIIEELEGPQRIVRFNEDIVPQLEKLGEIPLPPYISEQLKENERYQTVYSKDLGSAAAPTAGLHFTSKMLSALKRKGVDIVEVILHIGLDTFAPVSESNPEEHIIHTEWCQLSESAADTINQAKLDGGRIIAVGTTSVRVLESASRISPKKDVIEAFVGKTDLFILPGYRFRIVDSMITNFHLPRSTLIMLVSAFAGRSIILESYQEAIEMKYRFYSFGDAMFIF
jgi:S-adenosylmethionine:tRNA ribosyltransferase-isomerase